jgi:anti-anti-sigma regulatory factor
MSVTVQRSEPDWVIRIDGQATLASAGELKALLLEWVAAGSNLQLDLGDAEDIDIPTMQLLWAAAREAARTGVEIRCGASSAVETAVRESGFGEAPGFPISGVSHE